MKSRNLLIVGGLVAAAAATALLVPALAFGQPLSTVLSPGQSVVATDDRPGNGRGHAWGLHKDSPDFPGQGKGWGQQKDSPDFPGQGNPHRPDRERGNPHDGDR